MEQDYQHICWDVIMTMKWCSPAMYANRVFSVLDPEHELIEHRLYRQHCHIHRGNYVKDLAALGRDLSKVR